MTYCYVCDQPIVQEDFSIPTTLDTEHIYYRHAEQCAPGTSAWRAVYPESLCSILSVAQGRASA